MTIALVLEQSFQNHRQRRQFQRCREELLGAFLDRSNCEIDGTVGSKYQQRRVRIDFFKAWQEVESRAVSHHVVGNDNIRSRASKKVLGIAAVFCFVDLVALELEKVSDAETNAGFVINYQYSVSRHPHSPRWEVRGNAPPCAPRPQDYCPLSARLRVRSLSYGQSQVPTPFRRVVLKRKVQKFYRDPEPARPARYREPHNRSNAAALRLHQGPPLLRSRRLSNVELRSRSDSQIP